MSAHAIPKQGPDQPYSFEVMSTSGGWSTQLSSPLLYHSRADFFSIFFEKKRGSPAGAAGSQFRIVGLRRVDRLDGDA